jgi:hypothetical protein
VEIVPSIAGAGKREKFSRELAARVLFVRGYAAF